MRSAALETWALFPLSMRGPRVAGSGNNAVRRAAHERVRGHVLEPATSISPVVSACEAVNSSLLRNAIRAHRKIILVYEGGSGERTERVVWPILLGYRDAGRILAAWCELRREFRYFRTDRMSSADVLEQRIPENAPALRARWRSAMDQERASYANQP